MGRGDDPGKSDRIATIEALKEEEKEIMTMSPQQSINLSQRSGLESSEFKKSSSRDPMNTLA